MSYTSNAQNYEAQENQQGIGNFVQIVMSETEEYLGWVVQEEGKFVDVCICGTNSLRTFPLENVASHRAGCHPENGPRDVIAISGTVKDASGASLTFVPSNHDLLGSVVGAIEIPRANVTYSGGQALVDDAAVVMAFPYESRVSSESFATRTIASTKITSVDVATNEPCETVANAQAVVWEAVKSTGATGGGDAGSD